MNADAGSATQFTNVSYAPGDVNEGITPRVAGNAYLHGTTTQYAIGTNTDYLVRQANNAGTLTSVGPLGVAVGPRTSFDIDFDGTAYLADVDRFSRVDLATGAANFVGLTGGPIFGLAVAPPMAAVPEPATWLMMLFGFGFVGGMMRQRKQQVRVTYA